MFFYGLCNSATFVLIYGLDCLVFTTAITSNYHNIPTAFSKEPLKASLYDSEAELETDRVFSIIDIF